MRDIDNLCAKCFHTLTDGSVCTRCGYDNDTPNETFCLPKTTIVGGQYIVGAFLNRESDAVSYMGYDPNTNRRIIIREYCPKNFANRLEGSKDIHVRQKFVEDFKADKKSFLKLWNALLKLQHLSAVVPVYDVFEENGTAYAIIEHLEAIPLREYLLRNENGYIQWDSARIMFMPVLTTIEYLHNNKIVHGSITPDNLVLCRDGKVRLKPFTIQECCDASTDLEFNCTDGYTAFEQYDNKYKIGPSTDIYAFSACIYRALVGTNPPDAQARSTNDKLMIPNEIAETIPIHVIKTLGSGLQIYPDKRISNIETFREELDASPVAQAKAAEPIRVVDDGQPKEEHHTDYAQYTEYAKKQAKKKSKNNLAITILCILIVIAVGVGIFFIQSNNNPQQQPETTTEASYEKFEVPNFTNTGFTQTDIQNNAAWNEQFDITYTYEYSDSIETGIIAGQSIKAGETVNAGTNIVLIVSKGVQTEQVPNVAGIDFEEAKQVLEAKGFKVSSVEVYNDGSHIEHQVKSVSPSAPEADETVAVGTEVILQVYGVVQTTTEPPTTEATTKQITAEIED